jgi:type IV fimbrial biogenesis protein FimT
MNMRRMFTGFTLIEMMVTITIISILLAVAAPSYYNAITGTRMSGEINALLGNLNLARSEAIKRGQSVSVCPATAPSAATTACTARTDWSTGWVVLVATSAVAVSPGVTHGDTLTSTLTTYPTFTQAGYTFFTGTIKLHDSNSTTGLYRCIVFNAGSWQTQTGASCQ